jgi:hypothetical protein
VRVDTLSVQEWMQKQAAPNGNQVFTVRVCPTEIELRQLRFARVSGVLTSKSDSHSAPRVRDCCDQAWVLKKSIFLKTAEIWDRKCPPGQRPFL